MSGQPGVIIQQPGKDGSGFGETQYGMTDMAAGGGSVPRGLEYLASLDTVDVHQILELVEVLTGWEKNNQYQICNTQTQKFLHAKENTDCMSRQFCGNIRPLDITLTDMQGNPVMHVSRPLRCQGCCFPCCLQYMDIEYPVGQKVASIKEIWTCMTPKYEIVDALDQVMYTIQGDCCYCKCCADVVFQVFRTDGSESGQIVKHWGGCREIMGQANDFSVNYAPNELPLNKAILLGATFLVDFMYFERSQS